MVDHTEPQNWYFTFGYGHKHPNHYIKIHGTFSEARNIMIEKHGPKWAFQYSKKDLPMLKSYDIKEIKFDES